jgi:hypothetical protein
MCFLFGFELFSFARRKISALGRRKNRTTGAKFGSLDSMSYLLEKITIERESPQTTTATSDWR